MVIKYDIIPLYVYKTDNIDEIETDNIDKIESCIKSIIKEL
jgi:hypothetical protein